MKKRYMTPIQLERAITNKLLRLAILPIEDCNLDCGYCFEEHRVFREKKYPPMSPTIVRGVQNWIKKVHATGLQKCSLSWYGGEPLMAASQIEDISHYALGLQNLNTEGDMTTNGTALNRKMLDRMIACNVKAFKVSFDGPREFHDKTRVVKLSKKQLVMKDPKRKGTFDKIWENLLEAKASHHQFTITMRIHMHLGNIGPKMDSFVQELQRVFINGDERFQCEFEEIHDMGGVNKDLKKLIMKKEDQPAFHIARLKDLLGDKYLVSHQKSDAPPYWCYAAKLNNWVVRSDGKIGKCTVNLDATFAQLLENGNSDIFNTDLLNMFYEGYADGKIENFDLWGLACPVSRLKNKYGSQKMIQMGFAPTHA